MGFYDIAERPRVHVHRLKTAYPRLDFVESGMRYYNPAIGRWMSRDPIGERGGLLLYGFVGNEPVSEVDVLGLLEAWSKVALSASDKTWVEFQRTPADAKCEYHSNGYIYGKAGDKMTVWESRVRLRYKAIVTGIGSENNPFIGIKRQILEDVLEALNSKVAAAASNLSSLAGKQYTHVMDVIQIRRLGCVCECEYITDTYGNYAGKKMGWKCGEPKVLDKIYVDFSMSEMQVKGDTEAVKGIRDLLIEEAKRIVKDLAETGPQ